jgi:exodeoxyribonuclease III
VRVMSYNILDGGVDADGTSRLELIVDVIRELDPDLVALQEANELELRGQKRRFELERATGMRSLLGLSPSGYHGVFLIKPQFGVATWNSGSPGTNRILIEVKVITPGGLGIRVAGVHLDPFSADARLLGAFHATAAPPAIVMGDFNTCRSDDPGLENLWPRLDARLRAGATNLGTDVDDRALRAMEAAGFVDLYRRVNPGEVGATFPAAGVRLDYIFATADLVEHLADCQVYGAPPADRASDHIPLFADIDVA